MNKLKGLSLVMVLSLAPSGIAQAQSDANATNCTMNYNGENLTQECYYGSEGATSSGTNANPIIYQKKSPTKIPESSTTAGILIALSLGYFGKRKKLAQEG